MSEKKVIWVNYDRSGDMHWHSTKMDADYCASEDRIGCIRVELEARFDKEPIPTEPGALVGLTVRIKGDESRHWIVVADKRTYPNLPATRWPLVLCSPDGLTTLASVDDVLDLLT
jgi:hypothetical protein